MIKTLAAALGVAGAIASATPAHADVFDMCPDKHEGVVGGHTTCGFAANVRKAFYITGMSRQFVAYSPETGKPYHMVCSGIRPAAFGDGSVLNSVNCYAVDGNQVNVVIW